jgi:hypothetical protein
MADGDSAASKGAQSLRDTAKWLVGGVAATAAGVFAGGSLTSLGALDPTADVLRLGLAGLGLVLGFAGLAWVLFAAIGVLMVESRTIRDIASASRDVDSDLVWLRGQLEGRYKKDFPTGVGDLATYVERVDAAVATMPQTQDTQLLLARATRDFPSMGEDGAFQLVRYRFTRLVRALAWGVPPAAIGFAIFAWAANPPPASPHKAVFSLKLDVGATP